MAGERVPLALYHMLDAIEDFRSIVGRATAIDLENDRIRRYAAERCVEIISEASRRIPDAWKSDYPEIPWQKIAGIGSVIRHNYENVNPAILAELNGAPLVALERIALALLDKHDPEGGPFRKR